MSDEAFFPVLVPADPEAPQPSVVIRRHDGRYVDIVLNLPGAKANLCLEINEAAELARNLTAILAKAN